MKKSRIAILLIVAILIGSAQVVYAATNTVQTAYSYGDGSFDPSQVQMSSIGKVYVNGVELVADPNTMGFFFLDSSGRTMSPLRLLVEALGYEVQWFQDEQKIVIPNGPNGDVVLYLGEKNIHIGDEVVEMDVAAGILKGSGRTVIPLRYVAEALDCEINTYGWGSKSGGIIEITAPEPPEVPEKPVSTEKRNVGSLLDNPKVKELFDAQEGLKLPAARAILARMDSGYRYSVGFESDTEYFYAQSFEGLSLNLDAVCYQDMEDFISAYTSDAGAIMAKIKEFKQTGIDLREKYAHCFDDFGYWAGSDTDRSKYSAEVSARNAEYKFTNDLEDEARQWQTIGSSTVAFVFNDGIMVVIQ